MEKLPEQQLRRKEPIMAKDQKTDVQNKTDVTSTGKEKEMKSETKNLVNLLGDVLGVDQKILDEVAPEMNKRAAKHAAKQRQQAESLARDIRMGEEMADVVESLKDRIRLSEPTEDYPKNPSIITLPTRPGARKKDYQRCYVTFALTLRESEDPETKEINREDALFVVNALANKTTDGKISLVIDYTDKYSSGNFQLVNGMGILGPVAMKVMKDFEVGQEDYIRYWDNKKTGKTVKFYTKVVGGLFEVQASEPTKDMGPNKPWYISVGKVVNRALRKVLQDMAKAVCAETNWDDAIVERNDEQDSNIELNTDELDKHIL